MSDNEQVVLIAFTLNSVSAAEAQSSLMALLLDMDMSTSLVESWWIAEDLRFDRSDNESACFIPHGLSQDEARAVLEAHVKEQEFNKWLS